MNRLLVIGAGPIGLEAALAGADRGYDVTVLERDRIGASLLRWGATKFFTPIEMNVSTRTAELLDLPRGALLTGAEHAERVLVKLAASAPLAGRVLEAHAVVCVGRTKMTRRDRPGHPLRTERSFTVLADTPNGERVLEADVVLDATGTQTPLALGPGGVLAKGERAVAGEIMRYLGELHRRRDALAGKRTLVIGHGHSAANAIELLARVAIDHPETRVTWATRSRNMKPCVAIADDPLPERQAIVDRANTLARQPPAFLTVERRAHVEAVEKRPEGLWVRLSGDRTATYDHVLGLVGYRPDHAHTVELPRRCRP